MTNLTRLFSLFVLLVFCSAAFSDEKSEKFSWPVACTLGQDCWIVHYVDDDPSTTSARDFTCGHMTYEGHDGTDIAIKDHAAIASNVSVLAAADGTVLRTRDAVEDGTGKPEEIKAAWDNKNGCGNAVIIDHGYGWRTFYCHMKRGSISVARGQHVQRGDKLGTVGQSGLAEFPHMHFGVMHNDKIVDPFTGLLPAEGCGIKNATSLWKTPITYNPLILYAAGFSDTFPTYDRMVNDTSSPAHISMTAPIIAFWMLFYGAEPGDQITLDILDPEGKTYAHLVVTQPAQKIRMMKYLGARTADKPLHAGVYKGKATVLRTLPDGQTLTRSIDSAITVE